MTEPHEHWAQVYRTKAVDAVSWYQAKPAVSLALIADSGVARDAPLIDVGGGASTLVDHLLAAGYSDLTVLDLAGEALARSRERLGGASAARVHWLEADVTRFEPPRRYALWHDRAVFHFLTGEPARTAYLATVRRSLMPGGTVVLATFALDGPARCSGLEVVRYDAAALHAAFGADFELQDSRPDAHLTPGGSLQSFIYVRLRYAPRR